MPELRLTLMVVGGLFLIGLAWWELRRSHQVRGSDLPRPAAEPAERTATRTSDWDLPALELPRMSARDPEAQLPIVEVAAADFADLQARAEEADADVPAAPPGDIDGLLDELGANQLRDPPIFEESFAVAAVPAPPPAPPAAAVAADTAAPDGVPESSEDPAVAEVPAVTPLVAARPVREVNEVLAVRLVSTGEKFSGRAVRLALAAEGFTIGKFSIFHKAAADGHAVLSIASLTKPGTFDRQSIDMQRYSGLNLFTVLPGPLPGPQAVDELLECAQVLSQRLHGALQDEQGAPLTPMRTAALRNAAAATPT
jgi:FtsZ-interacting cell division protein ZipA